MQRPLATVVIVGIFFSTALTLVVLPGILQMLLSGWEETADEEDDEPALAPAE